MKKLIACAALATLLVACAEEAVEEAPVEEEAAEEAAMTLEGHVGAWEAAYPDGTTGVTTINADGTYDRMLGEEADSGTWTFEDGESCFSPDDSDASRCYYIGAADENGTRVATRSDDGAEVIINPVAEEEAAE